jgi:hypothetical protein
MHNYVATIPKPSADRLKPRKLVVEHINIDFGGGHHNALVEMTLDPDAVGSEVHFSVPRTLSYGLPVGVMDGGSYDRIVVGYANDSGTRGETIDVKAVPFEPNRPTKTIAEYAAEWFNHWLDKNTMIADLVQSTLAQIPDDVESQETDEFPLQVTEQGQLTVLSLLNTLFRPSGQVLCVHCDNKTDLPINFVVDPASAHPLKELEADPLLGE